MLSVAVGWHIYAATGNPFDLALVGLMQILPIAGLFIISGWVIDNLQRKHVLVVCALLQGSVLLGLASSLGDGEFDRLVVFGLIFLNGMSRAFFSPAIESTLPGIVSRDDLSTGSRNHQHNLDGRQCGWPVCRRLSDCLAGYRYLPAPGIALFSSPGS